MVLPRELLDLYFIPESNFLKGHRDSFLKGHRDSFLKGHRDSGQVNKVVGIQLLPFQKPEDLNSMFYALHIDFRR